MTDPGHEIISGSIGQGKSYWAVYKAIEMMKKNRPFAFIDPKGEMYDFFLAWFTSSPEGQQFWADNHHRVRFLNPTAKSGYVLGFNAIGGLQVSRNQTIDPVALTANAITSHIRYHAGFDFGEAARMTEILESGIGLLMAEGLTLSEFNFLFMPSYRYEPKVGGKGSHKLEHYNPMVKGILSKTTHLGTRRFWETDYAYWTPNAKQDWPQSSKNKIFNYIFNDRVEPIVCTDGGLDFGEIINGGMWLFVNLPYHWLSEESTSIVGNLIINRLFYTAMQRSEDAPDYRVFLDEARFFKGGDLPRIMETSRYRHFWLTLIVQSLNQLCRTSSGGMDYHLRDTALDLCRYFSVFGSNNEDDSSTYQKMMLPATGTEIVRLDGRSQLMSKEMVDELNRQTFVQLRPRQVVLHDKVDHKTYRKPTPDLPRPVMDRTKMDWLESQHLKSTGISTQQARDEIETRYEYWKGVVTQSQALVKTATPPPMGD